MRKVTLQLPDDIDHFLAKDIVEILRKETKATSSAIDKYNRYVSMSYQELKNRISELNEANPKDSANEIALVKLHLSRYMR